ncbi:aspartyl-phosphate phosphatase Spo0E family protein [Mesobacillus zeae]|uniref:Aspartyl-phosphate phosphatase Spo0E family protein n=1 Tax=Mesobacillus zeae TaxID=1917180 RepID=A0A398BHK1_9BACI|nr:aspartyl-phosphate phosphatase Spo0E family protein [Mesobacillus zeae]RID88108.1 aspartyl-phosphate phosphatase Spo0E family protein [Mesobacillus zeae]
MSKQELVTLIEKKRAELIRVASMYGFTSTQAIHYSQELDSLLNEYNRSYLQQSFSVH